MSTVGPQVSREAARRADAAGLRFVDAPVAGSTGPAERGTLGVFVGGSEDDAATVHPVIALWADPERIVHVGAVGAGSALKLVVNLSLGVAMAGLGEALRLAHDLALPAGTTLTALAAGPFGWTVGQKRDLIESGDFGPATFTLDLIAKDMGLALEESRRALPVVEASLAEMREAAAAGHGPDDYAALAGYLAGEGHPNST
jgi:3-hydroxyisobutyrate dehydrogenase